MTYKTVLLADESCLRGVRWAQINGSLVRAHEESSASNICRKLSAVIITTQSWVWFDIETISAHHY